jgi:RHS repeat-associated protein
MVWRESYSYDREGNLIREEGPRRQAVYEYNGANRMVYSEVIDEVERSGVTSRYAYDGLGRRTAEQDAGGAVMRVLYDGVSFEVIREGETYVDGSFRTRYGNGGAQINDNRGTEGSRYRWIGEGTNGVRTRETGEGAYSESAARWTGTKVTLYGKGEAVGVTRSGSGTVYLGKDVMGSVRSTTGGYGSIEERYEYDAFGEPYKGDLGRGMNLGYTGKPYDAATGLYNYGYRDYSPALARFTTTDPVRDGTNWFAYVNNDPVNWIDPWGLTPSDKSNLSFVERMGNLAKEFLDIFTVDVSIGAGFNVAIISNVGFDLSSKHVTFSTNGIQESHTYGINLGVFSYTRSAPVIEGLSGADSLKYYGKNEFGIGPVKISDDGFDVVGSFGAQAVVGATLEISGKELMGFLESIGELQNDLRKK